MWAGVGSIVGQQLLQQQRKPCFFDPGAQPQHLKAGRCARRPMYVLYYT